MLYSGYSFPLVYKLTGSCLSRKQPQAKYLPYTPIVLPDRQWPSAILTKSPVWVSTDLRDGNQALAKPLSVEEKILLFRQIIACGFKEVEVSFPSASETEYTFVRRLIEHNEVPEDVWIQVMAPSREDLLRRTFDAVRGACHVSIQLYSATASLFREVILKCTEEELIDKAVKHTIIARDLAEKYSALYGTSFRLVYGLESFSQSDMDFVIRICSQVLHTWRLGNPSKCVDECIVFNLAATVECSTPNHFADQVEYFRRNMPRDVPFIVGVHTHNDRGTAVASTEMALLAGAERVDGCLLGNGERSGNADLITLALNMYSQGIPPGLDFSNLAALAAQVTRYTRIPVHPRHPYVGSLVYTAYSGGHQDGIKKGFEAMSLRHQQAEALGQPKLWQMPYLPIDPTDFGFAYEAIRINSQSGKSGIAYVTEQVFGIPLPRTVQMEFASIIKSLCDQRGEDIGNEEISHIFRSTYHLYESDSKSVSGLSPWGLTLVVSVEPGSHVTQPRISAYKCRVARDRKESEFEADAGTVLIKFLEHLTGEMNYVFTAEEIHNDVQPTGCTSFLQLQIHHKEANTGSWIGIGQGPDITVAKLRGVSSAINRAIDSGLII